MAPARGGPQRIPRPEAAEPGHPPPWVHAGVDRLGVAEIEAALEARGPARVRGDAVVPERRSAVLVPLYEAEGEAWVVLTRRSSNMRSHTSEVSFPGGAQDPEDVDEWATAVREANEEVGLDPTLPRRIGELDRFVTVGSRSLIHPEVAALPGSPVLRASEAEVEHILHVPLSELLRPDVFREEIWPLASGPRAITFFELVGDTVWGATAAMLRQLLTIATGSTDSQFGPG